MKIGVLIGTYPIKIILAGGVFGFIIITTAFKNIKGKISKKDMFCDLKININSKSVYLKAIIDTGNFLREPITRVPVIVVEKLALKGAIPNEILDNLYEIINGESVQIEEYISKIKLIPFSSLGKDNGILLGLKAESITIVLDEKDIFVQNIIIGIYNGILSKNANYQALIGMELLEDKGGIDEGKYSRIIKV